MYGLVNRAVQELVIKFSDQSTWELVKQAAGVDVPKFLSMEPYPDEMTYALAGAACAKLEMPLDQFLMALGRHWILFMANEGYRALLDSAGTDLCGFLGHLDVMHGHLALSLPELNLPTVTLEESDRENTVLLHYYSDRSGLAPMVIGLLEGLSERFHEPCQILHLGAEGDHEVFELQFEPAKAICG